MKTYNKIFIFITVLIAAVFIISNLTLSLCATDETGRPYRVEIHRLSEKIRSGEYEEADLSGCVYVTSVKPAKDDFYITDSDYVIKEINGVLYRFEYTSDKTDDGRAALIMNASLCIMSAAVIITMLYLRRRLLLPFERLTDVPYELSKGNLTVPLRENKSRFFGKFIWGIDLLRENMEQQKERELELQKDKKMLLLSLSHDIKTPLSAIKLYAKALSKGLYKDGAKQAEIAESINSKADEIEGYVSQIITASREDFLSLDVNTGEFYLSRLPDNINGYYSEKLSLIKTEFKIGSYSDCILKGYIDRSVEVLQNVIENAIKYGDGGYIHIGAGEEEGCVIITVTNSGNTLSENELPYVFESFRRGGNSENIKGSGLGLYICRQLMHKMDGEIFMELKEDSVRVSAVFNKA